MTIQQIINKETMIWEGQDSFPDFAKMVMGLGYNYIVLCEPNFHSDEELGAACRNQTELVKTLLEFSSRGYFYTIFDNQKKVNQIINL